MVAALDGAAEVAGLPGYATRRSRSGYHAGWSW